MWFRRIAKLIELAKTSRGVRQPEFISPIIIKIGRFLLRYDDDDDDDDVDNRETNEKHSSENKYLEKQSRDWFQHNWSSTERIFLSFVNCWDGIVSTLECFLFSSSLLCLVLLKAGFMMNILHGEEKFQTSSQLGCSWVIKSAASIGAGIIF